MANSLTVNIWFIGHLLAHLMIQEIEQNEPVIVDVNDQEQLYSTLHRIVWPRFLQLRLASQEKCKRTLAFMICRDPDSLLKVLDSLQDLSMPEPKDPSIFLATLWRVLFGDGDRPDDVDLTNCVVSNDVMAVNELSLPDDVCRKLDGRNPWE